MHPCDLVCYDLLCLGSRALESGEQSCPLQSFCQHVHGVVAKIMIRRLHLPPMYDKLYALLVHHSFPCACDGGAIWESRHRRLLDIAIKTRMKWYVVKADSSSKTATYIIFCMEHYQNPNELAGGESWLYCSELRYVFKHKGNYIIRSSKYSMQHQCNFGLNLHILHSVERVYSKPIELLAEVCVYSSVNLVCESIKTRMN